MAFGSLTQRASVFSGVSHPFNLAYTSNVVAGSLLLCYTSSNSGENNSVTDSQGNIWTRADFFDDPTARWEMHWAVAKSSAANTVTVSSTPGAGSAVTYIFEYEGPFYGWSEADSNSDSGTSTASSTGNMTPVQNGSFFHAGHLLGADGTENGGWTNDVDELGGGVAFLIFSHLVQTTAAADSGDASLASAFWINAGAVFSPNILEQPLLVRIPYKRFGRNPYLQHSAQDLSVVVPFDLPSLVRRVPFKGLGRNPYLRHTAQDESVAAAPTADILTPFLIRLPLRGFLRNSYIQNTAQDFDAPIPPPPDPRFSGGQTIYRLHSQRWG